MPLNSPMTTPSSAAEAVALRYVALGNSYTIGTGVRPPDRWPDQLCAALGDDPGLDLVANLGVNGYTSADLIRHELPALEALAPEFASVLIGVNDVVQGVPTARYETNVAVILDALLERLAADRLIAVAIPDYTVTPAGAEFGDPRQRHAAIVAANAVMAAHDARARDRLGRHLRRVASGPRRSAPGGERWAPPEWSPVRPVGRADRTGRRGPARALISSSARASAPRAPVPGRSSVDRNASKVERPPPGSPALARALPWDPAVEMRRPRSPDRAAAR